MKKSKKIISVLLAVVMAFSLALPAFAATGERGEICKSESITVKARETKEVTFTADKAGIYWFDSNAHDDTKGDLSLYLGDVYELHTEGDVTWSSGNQYFAMDKGEKITLKVENEKKLLSTKTVEYTIEYLGNAVLKLGKTKIDAEEKYFKFVADKAGYYNFKSNAPADSDSSIEIITADDWFWSDKNGYEDNFNFDITIPLDKGEECLVYISTWDSVPFNVTVSYNKNIKAEKVFLEYNEPGETITLDRNTIYLESLSFVPTGSIYTAGITASVDNEKIASVEIVDFDSLQITPHKVGTTTLTLKTADGSQTTYTLKVQPHILTLIQRIINVIRYRLPLRYIFLPFEFNF